MLPNRARNLVLQSVGELGKVLSAKYNKAHRIIRPFQPQGEHGKVLSVSCNKEDRVHRRNLIQLVCVPTVLKFVRRVNPYCQPKAQKRKIQFHCLLQSLGKLAEWAPFEKASQSVRINNAIQIASSSKCLYKCGWVVDQRELITQTVRQPINLMRLPSTDNWNYEPKDSCKGQQCRTLELYEFKLTFITPRYIIQRPDSPLRIRWYESSESSFNCRPTWVVQLELIKTTSYKNWTKKLTSTDQPELEHHWNKSRNFLVIQKRFTVTGIDVISKRKIPNKQI